MWVICASPSLLHDTDGPLHFDEGKAAISCQSNQPIRHPPGGVGARRRSQMNQAKAVLLLAFGPFQPRRCIIGKRGMRSTLSTAASGGKTAGRRWIRESWFAAA